MSSKGAWLCDLWGSGFVAAGNDDQELAIEAAIDLWVEEHLAASPAWSTDKWRSILELLGFEDLK
ncbi:hypothetical protein OG196_25985 [Kitasatospora purpeofusca]|uniref:hypothetical protein n=1 Tax=Kitasatospora purpeofusca TaxID=67352 RepID=UPI002E14C578|nr:hypothetical protein OG196_25985 [Kitasatospora purpeofusca]